MGLMHINIYKYIYTLEHYPLANSYHVDNVHFFPKSVLPHKHSSSTIVFSSTVPCSATFTPPCISLKMHINFCFERCLFLHALDPLTVSITASTLYKMHSGMNKRLFDLIWDTEFSFIFFFLRMVWNIIIALLSGPCVFYIAYLVTI